MLKNEDQISPMLVTVQEAMRLLSLGHSTIYTLIGAGELDTIKVGRRRLIKMSSVHRLADTGAA